MACSVLYFTVAPGAHNKSKGRVVVSTVDIFWPGQPPPSAHVAASSCQKLDPGHERSDYKHKARVTTAYTAEMEQQGTQADQAIDHGRKVKAPHPSTIAHRQNVHRRAPPLPPKPSSSSHPAIGAKRNAGTSSTLPLKTLQGVRTRRTDSTKDGWERDVVFVTRNAPLGALMGRCRSLIMEEG